MRPPGEHQKRGGRETISQRRRRVERLDRAERLARGLGWFSLGLGITQLAAPRTLARMIGVRPDRVSDKTMRAIGAREIATGLGILSRSRPAGWLWARVLGNVMDLGLLERSLRSRRADRRRVAGAAATVLGVTVLDSLAGSGLSRAAREGRLPAPMSWGKPAMEAITVNRSREEVYRFWRDLHNLPRFTSGLEAVEIIDDRHSRWTARLPAGASVTWESEITADRPDELIAWSSREHAGLSTYGSVRFMPAPGERGTEVRVSMGYAPRGGLFSRAFAKLTGKVARHKVAADLHRFKQLMETGEVVKSDASIYPGPHAAQPPAEPKGTFGTSSFAGGGAQ
jgi:uncharacterized membrane protein